MKRTDIVLTFDIISTKEHRIIPGFERFINIGTLNKSIQSVIYNFLKMQWIPINSCIKEYHVKRTKAESGKYVLNIHLTIKCGPGSIDHKKCNTFWAHQCLSCIQNGVCKQPLIKMIQTFVDLDYQKQK